MYTQHITDLVTMRYINSRLTVTYEIDVTIVFADCRFAHPCNYNNNNYYYYYYHNDDDYH